MSYFLGIDPSTKSTGYAIMTDKGELVEYGKICPVQKHSVEDSDAEKILNQYKDIEALIKKYPFSKVLCEDQFFKSNVDTLKKLSRVSGMVLLLCAQHGIPVSMVYPASWRKVFHGKGSAKKDDTTKKVNEMFSLSLHEKKDNDISDAIGIACCAMTA